MQHFLPMYFTSITLEEHISLLHMSNMDTYVTSNVIILLFCFIGGLTCTVVFHKELAVLQSICNDILSILRSYANISKTQFLTVRSC